MQRGKIYLSIAEEEIVKHLSGYIEEDIGKGSIASEMEAIEYVIQQKRELAYAHKMRGNLALERQLKKELDEWSIENEEEFQEIQQKLDELKK